MSEARHPILHDPAEHRFYRTFQDAEDAELQYEKKDDRTLDFTSTFVPPSKRNRGLGSRLVETGLKYAEAQGLRVIPTCPFVANFMEEHPEYQDLRA